MSLTWASEFDPLITHRNDQTFGLTPHSDRLESQGNLALPLEEEKEFLQQLSEFELGRFLLTNKGLNGYWTAYIIIHGPQKTDLHPLENWFLHSAPAVRATQERYQIFKIHLQKHVCNGVKMASVPCGLMDDLLTLDYSDIRNVELTGIDLDENSVQLALANAKKCGIENVECRVADAWDLGVMDTYDLITSNGLNIYQPDNTKVINLYKEFYKALKVGGTLITSFLTPPPSLCAESTWENFHMGDVIKQKAIFADIIQVGWQAFRTELQTRQQLESAGFEVLEVIYDSQGMFPTIVARKLAARITS